MARKKNKIEYAYYVGCASENFTKELDISTREVCKRLEINLVEIPEFVCCGGGVIENQSEELQIAINARNLALAEAKGLDIVVTCSTCLINMRKAKYRLDADKSLRDKINASMEAGLNYSGKCDIKHIVWVLADDIGSDALKEKIKDSVKIAVAPYYGCHILRPSKFLGFEDPRNPKSIDHILEVCGAEIVDFEAKSDCCGFHTLAVNEGPSMRMSAHVLKSARDAGAKAIVVVCPFCHASLDAYQPETLRLAGEVFEIPVLHLTQFLGLALGARPILLGLEKNIVKADEVINTAERLQLKEDIEEESEDTIIEEKNK